MGPIIVFILLAILSNISDGKVKEKPLHYVIPDDKEADEEMEPLCPSRPYVVLSRKEKRHLELLIKTLKHDKDPNLMP